MTIASKLINALEIKNQTLKQGIKYIFVGGICTILDFFILYLGVELLGINYLPVSIFSFLCGVVLNYFLCTSLVFRTHVVDSAPLEFVAYVAISGVGLLINTGVIALLTGSLGLYVMLSKLIAAGITLFWNFFARKIILHSKKH